MSRPSAVKAAVQTSAGRCLQEAARADQPACLPASLHARAAAPGANYACGGRCVRIGECSARVRVWDVKGVTRGRRQGGADALGASGAGIHTTVTHPEAGLGHKRPQVQSPDLRLRAEMKVEGVCPMWASPPPDTRLCCRSEVKEVWGLTRGQANRPRAAPHVSVRLRDGNRDRLKPRQASSAPPTQPFR